MKRASLNSYTDLEWTDKVWTAYRHALVRFEIARQDLAVAVEEKDTEAEQIARANLSDWGSYCVQLGKVAQGILIARKVPDRNRPAAQP